MVICLERGADLHMAQWMPLSLTVSSVKSRLVLPFWYRLTWVILEKGPLNVCVCTHPNLNGCVCVVSRRLRQTMRLAHWSVCPSQVAPMMWGSVDLDDSVHRVLRHFNTAAIINAALLCKAQDVDYCYRYVRWWVCLLVMTVSCAKMAELIKMLLGSRYTQGHGEGAHLGQIDMQH